MSEVKKPTYKSTEFWLTLLAMFIGAIVASGVITDNSVLQYLGMAATILAKLGYTAQRGFTKAGDTKAATALELAKLNPTLQPLDPNKDS